MNALVYYGITLNASNMSGNQFLNFFILVRPGNTWKNFEKMVEALEIINIPPNLF